MGKDLKNMSLEELWQLFPIDLVPHREEWKDWARSEICLLAELLDGYNPAISHIGSTAIPSIYAKPIVDILVEVSADMDWNEIRRLLEEAGYICMSSSEARMSFNKGYTPEGYADKVFHIHIHACGDNDEIVFRDYLLTYPETAVEYERLKLSLLPEYRHNRDGYTDAKSEFVKRVVEHAKSCSHGH